MARSRGGSIRNAVREKGQLQADITVRLLGELREIAEQPSRRAVSCALPEL
jgi:hypothetical protein